MIKKSDIHFINILAKIASDLDHTFVRSKHAAALVVKNKIISIGVNKEKTHPIQRKYSRDECLNWTHAEIDCLKNVDIDIRKSTLYVVRSNTGNDLLESCPCEGCMGMIEDSNIKRVVHSVSNGIVELNLN